MTRGRLNTWTRLTIAGAMATTVGIAATATSSQAALDFDSDGDATTVEELTRFQIDGDKVPGASSNISITPAPGVDFDWVSDPYGPQPVGSDPSVLAPAGIGSSGLLPLLFENIASADFPSVTPSPNPAFGLPGEPEFCTPNNEDAWVGGTKVQDVQVDDPLYKATGDRETDTGRALDCSNVLGKGDLFSAYAAYENVAIPTVYGDPDSGTQNHTIVYGAWERGDVAGELNFYIPLTDADTSGNSAGDRLIAFDYDSSDVVSFRILAWDGDSWEIETSGNTGDSSVFFAAAVGIADGSPFDPDAGGGSAKPSFGEFALDITAAGILPEDTSGGCVELSTGGFVFTETGNSAQAQLKDYIGTPKTPIGNCGPLQVTKAGPAGAPADLNFDYRVEQLDSEDIFDEVPSTTPASTASQINNQFAIGDTDLYPEVFAEPDYYAFENPIQIGGSTPAPLPDGWEMTEITCTYIDAFERVDNVPVLVEDRVLWSKADGPTLDANDDFVTLQVHSRAFNELAGMPDFVPGCTITNSFTGVTVTKEGVGDDTQEFDITIDGEAVAPALTIGDTSALVAVVGGESVTVAEPTLPDTDPGWELESIVCSYEGDAGTVIVAETTSASSLDFVAVDGQVVNCVITNNQLPKLTLVKNVINNSGGELGADQWTLSADGATPFSGTTPASSAVSPGNYDLSESGPAGYTASVWDCTGGAVDGDTVALAYGDDITCTVVNDDDPPMLTLVKIVMNDNGGRATPDQWTLVADGYDDANPQAGTYDLSETGGPAGYTLTSLTCSNSGDAQVTSVNLGIGDVVTCTFVNDDDPPSLTLVKEVVNDNDGDATPDEWTLVADGYDDANPQARTYDLSETGGPDGYTLTSLTCDNSGDDQVTSVTLGLGEDVTCTFVNDDDPPANADLAIIKSASIVQTGPGGGFDWLLDITNNGPGTAFEVVIADEVPATLVVTGVSSDDFDCSNDGNAVECTVASLAVGAGGSVTINVIVPEDAVAGEIVNIGTVDSVTPDSDPSNNSDDASVVVVVQLPPEPPASTLPETGSDATMVMTRMAIMLLLLGGAVVFATRRREALATDA